MRKLIEDTEGDVYGPMVCVIPLLEYDIKEHDSYTSNGMGILEYNSRNNKYEVGCGDTYGYCISRDLWWIDIEGESHTKKISHYIPHDVLVTHFVYMMDHPNKESIDAFIRELKIDNLIE